MNLILEVKGQGHNGHVSKKEKKLFCSSSLKLVDRLTMVYYYN